MSGEMILFSLKQSNFLFDACKLGPEKKILFFLSFHVYCV